MIGLPQEINYGLLAIAPLGLAYAGLGIEMALFASALAVVITLVSGASLGRLAGPRPTLCILLAGLYASVQQYAGMSVAATWTLGAITVFLAGVTLLGAARFGLGRIIKYVPSPVLVGFNNGVAAMLLIYAMPMALGSGMNVHDSWLSQVSPWALFIALLTYWVSEHPLRYAIFRYVPGILQALILAWLVQQLFQHGFGLSTGPVLRDMAHSLPETDAVLSMYAAPAYSLVLLWTAVKYSLAIAVTAALETLATAATLDTRNNERTSGNRELARIGLTLVCVSPLGMPVANSLGRSTALQGAKPATRSAHLVYALFLLVVGVLGYGLLAQLPQAAIAGILLVVARSMFGHGLGQAALPKIGLLKEWGEFNRHTADFLVMLLVAVISVADSIVTGLAIGVVSAMILFIRDQSRSVVRRVQFGNLCHSLKLRSPEARALQKQYGHEIVVIEAEGTIFFGSAESLEERIEALSATSKEIILDLRRVGDVDSTACMLLGRTLRRLHEKGCQLTLSTLTPGQKLHSLMLERDLAASVPVRYWLPDLDTALEQAESRLLARHGLQEEQSMSVSLDRSALATGLSEEQLQLLEYYMVRRNCTTGEMIFHKGDQGTSIYVLVRGSVSIRLPSENGGLGQRLVALGPGALLGEMAFITGAPRSADARVDEETELLELDRGNFEEIEILHPDIAIAMLSAISSALAGRLNDRTEQVRELAEA